MSRTAITNEPKMEERPPTRWQWRPWHWYLLITGLVLRIAFILTVDKESSFGGWDGKEYYGYGKSLLALQWDNYPRFFNAIRPPLYPVFLTPFLAVNDYSVWHIQIFQCALGVLQAVVLAKIAGRWVGQRAGNWALIIAIFNPFLIYYCGFVLTETLFITLLWLSIACLQRLERGSRNHFLWLVFSCVSLGLATLTRPSLQLFLPLVAAWLAWRTWRIFDWRTAVIRVGFFTALVSILLLPWMFRNLYVHDEFSLAPGLARLTYGFSNSPDYLRMYEARTKQEYYEVFQRLTDKVSVPSGTLPETWMAEARDFRQNHRADWWRLQWYKFKHFWTPWLNPLIFSRGNVLISVLAITPLFLFAAVELIRRRSLRDPFLLLLLGLIFVGYLVGGFLFHVQVRYRFPYVDVAFLVLTASFLGQVQLNRIAHWKFVRRIRQFVPSSA